MQSAIKNLGIALRILEEIEIRELSASPTRSELRRRIEWNLREIDQKLKTLRARRQEPR